MFQKILVPVDGSDKAMAALDKAIQLQALTQAEIYLISVYKHHSLYEVSMSMVREEDVKMPTLALKEFATEVAEYAKHYAVGKGINKVRAFVKGGGPSSTIIKFAKDRKIDLIVMGSHGAGESDGYFLGSVSQRVASKAKCPILLV